MLVTQSFNQSKGDSYVHNYVALFLFFFSFDLYLYFHSSYFQEELAEHVACVVVEQLCEEQQFAQCSKVLAELKNCRYSAVNEACGTLLRARLKSGIEINTSFH